jgi:adenylate cyclase
MAGMFLLLSLPILLIAGTLLGVFWWGSVRAAQEQAREYLVGAGKTMHAYLEGFFHPIESALELTQELARQGVLHPERINEFAAFCQGILRTTPQISSICTGQEDGFSHRQGVEGEGFLGRLVFADTASRPSLLLTYDATGKLLDTQVATEPFDARTRPWYAGALGVATGGGSGPKYWSPPFILHTSQNSGIALSAVCQRADGGTFVITFNIMLDRISNLTSRTRPSLNGYAMVLDDRLQVIGRPRRVPNEVDLAGIFERLPRVEELQIPALSVAARGFPYKRWPFSFECEGATWWALAMPYTLPPNNDLLICLVSPEDDFLHEAIHQRNLFLAVTVVALLVNLLLGIGLARSFSRPLADLAEASKAITALDFPETSVSLSRIQEIHQLAVAQARMQSALESFARYVPTEVVRELLARGEAAKLGGHVQEVTLLFCDIKDFTTLAESLDPVELSVILSEYFQDVMAIIRQGQGTIDKIIGDALMAMWNAPREVPGHPVLAVRTALACQAFMTGFRARAAAAGKPILHARFGLSFGKVVVGNFGAPDRMNYTCFGDCVNLASRLEGMNKLYGTGILVSEALRQQAGDAFHWRLVDLVIAKGKTQPERIYEPLGEVGQVAAADLAFAAAYEAAFAAYLDRRFGEVDRLLEPAFALRPDDLSCRQLRQIAQTYQQHPPGPDWKGVHYIRTK